MVVLAMLVAAMALAACGGDDAQEPGGSVPSRGGAEEAEQITTSSPLTIGGWGGSYNDATQKHYLDPFEQERGPQSRFVDASGTQVARLEAQQRSGRVQWDLVDSISGADAFVAFDKGLLEPLPPDLKRKLVDLLGEGKVSDFGFTMGNLGNAITCNMERMDSCPQTPADFFDPVKFPQQRTIKGFGPIETATLAMVAAGTPASETSTTPVDLDVVFEQLDRIKDEVRTPWQSGDQGNQLIRGGEVDMGILWTGRMAQLQRETGMNLQVNLEGAAYEPGYWAVVKDAPNREAAFALMEWIAEHPEQQAKWSQELQYSVPNPKALEFMPREHAEKLVDAPENFDKLAVPNYAWYVENADELNRRWQDWLRG
jgi:putative spermidine/putrescine transport system substrate-binding protein